MEVHGSIDIAAPPAKIWPLLVVPANILKWCTTFRKFEYRGEQRGKLKSLAEVRQSGG